MSDCNHSPSLCGLAAGRLGEPDLISEPMQQLSSHPVIIAPTLHLGAAKAGRGSEGVALGVGPES